MTLPPVRGPGPRRRAGDVLGRSRPDTAVGRDVLALAGERAVGWDLAVEGAGAQVVEELVELLGRDAIAVAVVDLQARRLGTRRLALGVLERDQAVWCRPARPDAERLLGMVHQLGRAHQRARHRLADVDEVLADGLELEHLVERRRTLHLRRGVPDQLGDVRHRLVGQVAVLLLRQVQQRDQRRLRPRVAADDLLGDGHVGVGESCHLRPVIVKDSKKGASSGSVKRRSPSPAKLIWYSVLPAR